MKKIKRISAHQKRQYLINELIRFGIYKKNNKHLYEWTLSELETEYQNIDASELELSSNLQLK
ncbi:Fur-regulated basic protein FbpA [Bacillus sp. AFS073361]|uniref:Fur-regulated basic protein FbpA n=1 Tax=Bacillaceae TaxID=186817 RepID=UPI000BFA396B|nr:Fur-regulated basic protein FbpA [Bacillus sp. AFS073361]PFP29280.1 Fur-regulated basic protein FbpA [Bacillus sp. AFS073361]